MKSRLLELTRTALLVTPDPAVPVENKKKKTFAPLQILFELLIKCFSSAPNQLLSVGINAKSCFDKFCLKSLMLTSFSINSTFFYAAPCDAET